MIEVSNMIMVGALSRNIGKTEFACALIRELSKKHRVCGVKVTTIHANDYDFHEDVPRAEQFLRGQKSFEIREESAENAALNGTDTAKMLYNGAKRAFWVCSSFKDLAAAAKNIAGLAKPFEFVVCESNSLRHHIKPKQFILLEKPESVSTKPESETIRTYADMIINQFDDVLVKEIVCKVENGEAQ